MLFAHFLLSFCALLLLYVRHTMSWLCCVVVSWRKIPIALEFLTWSQKCSASCVLAYAYVFIYAYLCMCLCVCAEQRNTRSFINGFSFTFLWLTFNFRLFVVGVLVYVCVGFIAAIDRVLIKKLHLTAAQQLPKRLAGHTNANSSLSLLVACHRSSCRQRQQVLPHTNRHANITDSCCFKVKP